VCGEEFLVSIDDERRSVVHEFLMSLIPWGTEAIVWVQGFRTPALDSFFKALTFLGEEEFYLLLLPLVYWVINKTLGVRLAFFFLPGVYLNSWLKEIFFTPRPDPARVTRLVEETSYVFPSGHTQNSTILWGLLAMHVRRWFFWVLGAFLVVGIAFSRVYLGIHYPQDLLGGFFFGIVYLLLFFWLEKPVGSWVGKQILPVRLGLAFLVPILLLLLNLTEGTTTPMATLAGFGVAHVLETRWVRFETGGLWWKCALRFLVGLVMVAIAYLGLKVIFPEGLFFQFVRYGCVGLAVGLIAPWTFVKIGLAASEGETKT
jgi:membrane-associated phospholipid phosphatase